MGSRVASPSALAAVLAAIVVGAIGCGGEAQTVDDCVRDLSPGLTSKLPPAQAQLISYPKLGRAARPLCAVLVREQSEGRLRSDGDVVSFMRTVLRDRPALWKPVCNVVIDAEFQSLGSTLRAISETDRARYREGVCRLGVRYMRADGSVDLGRMVRKHRGLFVPFCAAGVQQALDRDAGSRRAFSGPQRRAIARRTCDVAIRDGVMDFGATTPAGEPELDELGFERIFNRVAADVAR